MTSKDSIGFGKGGGETLLSEEEEETLTLVDEGESSLEIAEAWADPSVVVLWPSLFFNALVLRLPLEDLVGNGL